MVTALKILFGAVFVFITYQVITTSLQSNLFREWEYLGSIPWMRATLYDFYANALLIALWVMYKETKWYSRVLWVLLLAGLGSIATSAYVLIQLFRLKKGEPLKELLLKQH
jgi:hypothetical protein